MGKKIQGKRIEPSTRSGVNMKLAKRIISLGSLVIIIGACSESVETPTMPSSRGPAAQWGPESGNFNLEAILRGDGFGLVKFRQANDDFLVVELGVWVRGLEPNTNYVLQRAVDTTIDDLCASTAWLTLGQGSTPHMITTDSDGNGRADLFRSVAAFPVGSTFDIHFQVVKVATSAVVLSSSCYQFTISQ
jgi:hypothetical protein